MKGIYTILSRIDKKLYVGYTTNIEGRFAYHRSRLLANKHHNRHLQSAYNKYGRTNFIYEILEECEERFLKSAENYWCNMLDIHNDKYGYNIAPTISEGNVRQSKESIERRTRTRRENAKKRGYWTPQSYIDRLRKEKQGKPVNPKMIIKMIEATSKPVIQKSKSGEFIANFPSQAEAGRRTGINSKGINAAIRGKYKTCGGFIWENK